MTQMKSAEPGKPRSIGRAFGRIFGLGIPATAVMTAALAMVFAVAIDGCSGKSKKSGDNLSQNSPNTSNKISTIATADPTPSPAPAVVAKKKTVKRPSTVTYVDKTYGLSFRYPRKYKLLTPNKGEQNKEELAKLPMNFLDANGSSIAAIELNTGSATAFMNVSVVKGMGPAQCGQFAMASPQSSNDTPIETDDESGVSKVSLRGVEFSKSDEVTEQLEARYYHHFEPGADKTSGSCYEFALGISEPPESSKPVDDVAIFEQLERVFGTVKIKTDLPTSMTASVPEQPAGATNPQ